MQQSASYLPSRVLKLNVGFLMDGHTNSKDIPMDLPRVQVDDELMLESVVGELRISRTKEGLLVQGDLQIGVVGECYRCLDDVARQLSVHIEELYATSNELSAEEAEFHIYDDGQLDLAPLLRAEVLIQTTRGLRCEDEAACTERMQNLEEQAGIDHIDPRMAKLRELLNSDDQ